MTEGKTGKNRIGMNLYQNANILFIYKFENFWKWIQTTSTMTQNGNLSRSNPLLKKSSTSTTSKSSKNRKPISNILNSLQHSKKYSLFYSRPSCANLFQPLTPSTSLKSSTLTSKSWKTFWMKCLQFSNRWDTATRLLRIGSINQFSWQSSLFNQFCPKR